jgi:hypothetical protein
VAEDAVLIERVSASNSLLTGKFTGNFAEPGADPQFFAPSRRVNTVGYSRIPYAAEQGISFVEQGKVWSEQGIKLIDRKRPFLTHLFVALRTRSVLATTGDREIAGAAYLRLDACIAGVHRRVAVRHAHDRLLEIVVAETHRSQYRTVGRAAHARGNGFEERRLSFVTRCPPG